MSTPPPSRVVLCHEVTVNAVPQTKALKIGRSPSVVVPSATQEAGVCTEATYRGTPPSPPRATPPNRSCSGSGTRPHGATTSPWLGWTSKGPTTSPPLTNLPGGGALLRIHAVGGAGARLHGCSARLVATTVPMSSSGPSPATETHHSREHQL